MQHLCVLIYDVSVAVSKVTGAAPSRGMQSFLYSASKTGGGWVKSRMGFSYVSPLSGRTRASSLGLKLMQLMKWGFPHTEAGASTVMHQRPNKEMADNCG